MTLSLVPESFLTAIALTLAFVGSMTALLDANIIKRIGGVLTSTIGALVGLSTLKAGDFYLITVIACALAYVSTAVALLVRIQEAYGGIEAPLADAADQADEPMEPQG